MQSESGAPLGMELAARLWSVMLYVSNCAEHIESTDGVLMNGILVTRADPGEPQKMRFARGTHLALDPGKL